MRLVMFTCKECYPLKVSIRSESDNILDRAQPAQLVSVPFVETQQLSTMKSESESRSSHFSTHEIRYEISMRNGVASRTVNQQFVSSNDFQRIVTVVEEGLERTQESEKVLKRPVVNLQLSDEQRVLAVQMGQETVQRKMLVFVACAAQIIEWTSKGVAQKESQILEAVSTMVTTIENINVCIWELCSVLNNADVAFMLKLTSDLSLKFGEFLGNLDPNKKIKRSEFLASASRIGETSFAILNSLNEDEEEAAEDQQFYTAMNEAIQGVANTTAALILQTKNIPRPISAGMSQSKSPTVEMATEVAVLTSELIALARILAPIIGHPSCQERVSASTQKVEQAMKLLVSDMFTYCAATKNPDLIDDVRKKAADATTAMKTLVKQIQE